MRHLSQCFDAGAHLTCDPTCHRCRASWMRSDFVKLRSWRFVALCSLLSILSHGIANAQSSGAYIDLHDFGGTVMNANGVNGLDGGLPSAGVTFDRAGNMYGTASSGGVSTQIPGGGGIVWEITSSGAYKDLHDFGGTVINSNGQSGLDGFQPTASVTFDSAGNMYGTTNSGGAYDDGIVWEITKSGAYRDLHDFGGTVINSNGLSGPDGRQPTAGVTFDSAGNMYGTTSFGGRYSVGFGGYSGMVWEITSSGGYKDLHDFAGTVINSNGQSGLDGFNPSGGVTFDSAGNAYGTAGGGGAYGSAYTEITGIVWEITSSGTYRDLHDFGGTTTNANGKSGPDGTNPTAGSTFDSEGNMFGTTSGGGANSGGVVWEITSSGAYKDLHDFAGTVINSNGQSGLDGYNPSAGVTFDSAGNMYGSTRSGGANYLSSYPAGMVWEITSSGTYKDLHDFAGTVIDANGMSGPDGQCSAAGVTFDSAGNLYGTTMMGGASVSEAISYGVGIVWEIAVNLPKANSQTVQVTGASAITLTGTDPHKPPQSLTYAIVAAPSHGTLSGLNSVTGAVTYVPNASFHGADIFSFAASNGVNTSTAATVTLIAPITITSFSVTPNALYGGASVAGKITLSAPAPPGLAAIPITSSNTSVVSNISVAVPTGQSQATFAISTKTVSTSQTVTLTATSNGTTSAQVTVLPIGVRSITLSPNSVVGSLNATAVVTLQAPSSGNTTVTIVSSYPSAAKPTVTSQHVPVGAKTALFTISTSAVSSATSVTFTATANGISATAVLTVTVPRIGVQLLTVAPSTTSGGHDIIGIVTMLDPAINGSILVMLTSSNPSIAPVPATVTVSKGMLEAPFLIVTHPVTSTTTVTITATANGTSQSAKLTLTH